MCACAPLAPSQSADVRCVAQNEAEVDMETEFASCGASYVMLARCCAATAAAAAAELRCYQGIRLRQSVTAEERLQCTRMNTFPPSEVEGLGLRHRRRGGEIGRRGYVPAPSATSSSLCTRNALRHANETHHTSAHLVASGAARRDRRRRAPARSCPNRAAPRCPWPRRDAPARSARANPTARPTNALPPHTQRTMRAHTGQQRTRMHTPWA